MLDEINKKLETNIERENIQYILDFTLLWNLFELYYFDKYFDFSKISSFVNDNISNIDSEKINEYYSYFYKRYISDDEGYYRLEKLINEEEYITILKNYLNKNSDDSKKLLAITYIISRYRNNLFHGSKKIELIEGQKDNFEISNNFLIYFVKKGEI